MPSHTFSKEERLKSRKIISQLFKQGVSINAFPLRLIWMPVSLPSPVFPIQFALTVPKRAFPKATQRNRLRRLMREQYRLNKHLLYEQLNTGEQQFAWMLIYIAKEAQSHAEIEKAMLRIIHRFLKNQK
ncbi:MAG: ribonuclease P protein component [Bacteroidota bacterium]